jgi:isoleucyl-tRNA synthetase
VVLATPDIDVVKPHLDILRDEVNVKSVILTEDVAAHGTEELVLAPKALGPRLGASTQRVIAAHKAGDWSVVDGTVTVGGEVLEDGEYEFRLVSRSGEGAAATLPRKGGIVVLDTVITAELATEGQARDLIRRIQNARRESGLAVSDRVRLELVGDLETIEAFEAHREMVLSETLTIETEISVGESEQLLVTAVA